MGWRCWARRARRRELDRITPSVLGDLSRRFPAYALGRLLRDSRRVAVPIRNHAGEVVAARSVGGRTVEVQDQFDALMRPVRGWLVSLGFSLFYHAGIIDGRPTLDRF